MYKKQSFFKSKSIKVYKSGAVQHRRVKYEMGSGAMEDLIFLVDLSQTPSALCHDRERYYLVSIKTKAFYDTQVISF